MLNYLEVSDNVKTEIMEECKPLNATPLLISKVSNNEKDNYLYYVLAKRNLPNFDESNCYVVWLYNSSLKGLSTGSYMLSYVEMIEEYNRRLH